LFSPEHSKLAFLVSRNRQFRRFGLQVVFSFPQQTEMTRKNEGRLQNTPCAPSTRVLLGSLTDIQHSQMPRSQISLCWRRDYACRTSI